MKIFQAVLQHGAIFFLKNIFPYLNTEIGIDSKNIVIKSCVMDFAKRNAILNDGIPQR